MCSIFVDVIDDTNITCLCRWPRKRPTYVPTHPTGDGLEDVTATVVTLVRDQYAIKGPRTMSSTLGAIPALILQFLS